MTTNTVLLISNDCESAAVWAYALRRIGLDVALANSAAEGLARWRQGQFDLILIDVCDLALDGVELVRQVCAEAANPVLLFTPKHDEAHVLSAYQAGVDECVVKPISPALFLAKVRAWLRRAWTVRTGALDGLTAGPLCLVPLERAVLLPDGTKVRLSNLEFRVLHLLMSHPNQTLPAEVIVERIWGYHEEGGKLLKNVIYRLRHKIEPSSAQPRYLQTGPAGGYSFTPLAGARPPPFQSHTSAPHGGVGGSRQPHPFHKLRLNAANLRPSATGSENPL